MQLIVDTDAAHTSVREATDLKRLSATVHGTGDIARALGKLGRRDADGAHLWIAIDGLRAAAAPAGDAAWLKAFDGMIAYATGKGWVDAATACVRVHITPP